MPPATTPVGARALEHLLLRLGVASLSALLGACEGVQSALDPAGPIAREIAWLWWSMAGGAALIFGLVVVLLLYAVLRNGEGRRRIQPKRLVYAGGIVLPVVVLSVLMPFGVQVGTGASAPSAADTITIHIRGNQWWWDVEYDLGPPSMRFRTANQLLIPTGEPVELLLTSADVVHSFWVPRLAGKLDLIPGRTNRLMIEADEVGLFRGQCAEYCGMAHAKMALHVRAVPREEFDGWVEAQLRPAPQPQSTEARQGAALFRSSGCALCHTVRGHAAWGRVGPDLTTVGSRPTIGAGALVSSVENTALWIGYNDAVKPGNRMPEFNDLSLEARTRIAMYLETLE